LNNTKLVHWPLTDWLLHLVQQGRAWAGYGSNENFVMISQTVQELPCWQKNKQTNTPTNGHYYWKQSSSLRCRQGWQVSADIGLNRFKLDWQKQVSDSFWHCQYSVFTPSCNVHYRVLRGNIAAGEY